MFEIPGGESDDWPLEMSLNLLESVPGSTQFSTVEYSLYQSLIASEQIQAGTAQPGIYRYCHSS